MSVHVWSQTPDCFLQVALGEILHTDKQGYVKTILYKRLKRKGQIDMVSRVPSGSTKVSHMQVITEHI